MELYKVNAVNKIKANKYVFKSFVKIIFLFEYRLLVGDKKRKIISNETISEDKAIIKYTNRKTGSV